MHYSEGNRLMNQGDKNGRQFNNNKTAKLGTKKNPANVVVQTEERFKEIKAIALENSWVINIEHNEEKEENIADLEFLQQMPTSTAVVEKTPGRNDPCSCGSGKKFKKCCG
ncbi:SEC-C metal-binding domain-containing protein [Sansalvadorimonas sp. 2012CJ34-2]|uniref:SEC-C metal-binding domain-containing protein n=1 Tax=Parendozoicomonas callyspongiae TaxID=2942213 RepID=A0ABT0PF19_9GAMM|nr:PBPRA1643 family SWIM/SEC-C metal-binding motif protein [Sansalvadorimonas sp. 2012CJ34-2]MCL6269362.1 SEC-C metal-binding domain-containing protein [Sansalvadorimonas sp. 2012CJ34-2]